MSFIRHYSKRDMRAGGPPYRALVRPHRRGIDHAMRAYVGLIGHSGLQRFLAQDAVPSALLQELVREWTSPAATAIGTVVDEEDAEAIRRELAADRHDVACNLLLNRAFELV